jgi:hypothetical protein
MSSDHKGLVFFGKLDQSEKFQKSLREIRGQFDVPLNGFKTKEKASDWLWNLEYRWNDDMFKKDNKGYRKLKAYKEARKQLIRYFKIPPIFARVIDQKISYAKNIFPKISWPDFGCTILEIEDRESTFDPMDDWEGSYATILIHQGANRSGVREYISQNWDKIEAIIKKVPRLRKRTKQERDNIVLSLCCKSSKELGVRDGLSREPFIKNILAEDYHFYMSEGNIKRICAEQRRIKK